MRAASAQRFRGEHDAVGVEARVQLLDPRQRGVDELAGRQLTAANESRLLCRPEARNIDLVHATGP